MNQKRIILIGVLAVVFGCLLATYRVSGFEFIIMDDFKHLTENPLMVDPSFETLFEFWKAPFFYLYIPFTYTVWQMIAKFSFLVDGNLNPFYFHTTNLIFHIINSVLVFFVCLKFLLLTEIPQKSGGKNGNKFEGYYRKQVLAAVIGALFFSLHPVQVEPVAWASGFKDLLSTALALKVFHLYLDQFRRGPDHSISFTQKRYSLMTVIFALACLSKPNTMVLPFILGFSHWVLSKETFKAQLRQLVPWVIFGLMLIVITKSTQPNLRIVYVPPLWQRFFIAGEALYEYVLILLYPFSLIPDYPNSALRVVMEPTFYIRWLLPTFVFLMVWFKKRASQLNRIGLVIFFVNLLPVLGFIPFEFQNFSTISDRYLYFSIIGVSLMIAGTIQSMDFNLNAGMNLTNLTQRRAFKKLAVAIVILCVLGVQTWRQSWLWRNSQSLFEYTVSVNSLSYLGWYSLAGISLRRGNAEAALHYFQQASAVLPNSIDALLAIGTTLLSLERFNEAISHFQKSLAIIEADQAHYFQLNVARMRNNLAIAYLQTNRRDDAVRELQEALRIDPSFDEARKNLDGLNSLISQHKP